MNEPGYITAVNKRLHPWVYVWKIADRFTSGIPDCWYSVKGGTPPFIEFKYLKELPKRDNTLCKAPLSDIQLEWHLARQREGVPVWTCLGINTPTGNRGVLFSDPLIALQGISAYDFDQQAMNYERLARRIELIASR